ncbi:MAG: proline dehydrogenase family protein [Anaerolineales bacterium]|nr:proline dehydrogenase family protein [Anaerolineales bacterium]MDW8228102.1 proline dehydrogenase family protein [Anaerolineales bacterium]
MLRAFFVSLSKAKWAQRLITRWGFAWRAASRFVAGDTIADAVQVVRELNARGINATLDHLGESTTTVEEAIQAKNDILALLEEIDCCDVRANVSIKLTQIGLALSEALCAQNLEEILACASQHNNFIRIDMEDSPYVDRTYRLYRLMRAKGYENVGVVVQSYLYRSEQDVRTLLAEGARFRLVKGAYKEPPEIAFPKKADVDANFDLLTQLLLDASLQAGAPAISPDGRVPPIPAIATHDPKRIEFAKAYAAKIGLPKNALEFQMLYGIRRDLQEQCASEGYPVRVYVPYGTHWYPYFMRRLAERPANVWFFLSNLFRR